MILFKYIYFKEKININLHLAGYFETENILTFKKNLKKLNISDKIIYPRPLKIGDELNTLYRNSDNNTVIASKSEGFPRSVGKHSKFNSVANYQRWFDSIYFKK